MEKNQKKKVGGGGAKVWGFGEGPHWEGDIGQGHERKDEGEYTGFRGRASQEKESSGPQAAWGPWITKGSTQEA